MTLVAEDIKMKRGSRSACCSVFQLILLTLLAFEAAGDPHPSQAAAEAARRRPRPPAVPPAAGFPVLPGIFRLDGSDPNLPQEDLEPLRQIIGNAEMIALGESFHTSGGYYEMKHRIFRYLVERLGVRVFAIESPWAGAEQVAQFVETCEGSPDEALRGLFGVWQGKEVLDLVQWMCDWNQAQSKPRDRVHFHGFDTQQPQYDGPTLLGFLERVGVGPDHPIAADLRQCDGVVALPAPPLIPESSNDRCQAGLQAAEQLFSEDRKRIVAETSKEDLAWARINLTGLKAWQGQAYYRGRNRVRSTDSRDHGMAEVLLAIHELRYPGLKTAIWAHNFHIAKQAELSSWGTPTMGTYLHNQLGPRYVALGLIGHQVSIDWPGVGCGILLSSSLSSGIEFQLLDLGYDNLLIDLDFPGTTAPFLETGKPYQMTDGVMVPVEQFDAVFFLRSSRAMAPLRWPPC